MFLICFSVCACGKRTDIPSETTESVTSQTKESTATQLLAETSESSTRKGTETSIKSESKVEISTKNQWVKPTKSTTTTKYVKPTYATDIDGYVTLPDSQIATPDPEPEIRYVITDVKSNISGKISLSGMELTVDQYSGAMLYINYTVRPGNKLYQNSDFTMQKLVNGQWTDLVQIREIDSGKTTDLNRGEKYTYSFPEYYHLDKYFNNPEDGRYKIMPQICTDIDMKNSAGFEIEFTITKHTVKEASMLQKIENPVCADFSLASYSTNYTYTLFDSRQIKRVAQLYNNLKFSPIEKPETLYGTYLLTVIDSDGYEHWLILYNGGVVVSRGSNYYFAENGGELYDYLDGLHMNI